MVNNNNTFTYTSYPSFEYVAEQAKVLCSLSETSQRSSTYPLYIFIQGQQQNPPAQRQAAAPRHKSPKKIEERDIQEIPHLPNSQMYVNSKLILQHIQIFESSVRKLNEYQFILPPSLLKSGARTQPASLQRSIDLITFLTQVIQGKPVQLEALQLTMNIEGPQGTKQKGEASSFSWAERKRNAGNKYTAKKQRLIKLHQKALSNASKFHTPLTAPYLNFKAQIQESNRVIPLLLKRLNRA